jgi:prepilin-type N-terminal cleavage/methylation domain-containing protein/prepilin-type processing-associated H-X9-DG protein
MDCRRAFTLIELLVVITIVAVLAGMLMPALASVRNAAQGARCGSSLGQLALATVAYAADWDQLLPRLKTPRPESLGVPIHWFDAIAPQLGLADDQTATSFAARFATPIWGCPVWPKSSPATLAYRPGYGFTWYPLAPQSYRTTFCWNEPGGGFNNFGVDIGFQRITQQGRRIMLGESVDWPLSTASLPVSAYPASWDPRRHRGRASYAFFDGHVQALNAGANAYLGNADPESAAWNP